MNSGKVGNELNLSLETPEVQRQRTLDLGVGFNEATNEWELIVKFNGDLSRVADQLGFTYVELLNGYAVIVIADSKVDELANFEEIEYIEKPKGIFFEVLEAIEASCIPQLQTPRYDLTGNGILIAIIDSGIDYSHPDFRFRDGKTRILYLWDQTINSTEEGLGPPPGFVAGTLYTEERINEALQNPNKARQLEIVPSIDLSGHGTHVAGIAAGNGAASDGRYVGVAPNSRLIVVKLGRSIGESFPSTAQLMTAVDFVIRKAVELRIPLSINVSFGNNYGSHTGNSIVEKYLNDVSNIWKISIVVGTGNEGAGRTHTSGVLQNNQSQIIELAIGEAESSISVQIWKNYFDVFDITIIPPSGNRVGPIPSILGKQQFVVDDTQILLYYGVPQPIDQDQEIFIVFLPQGLFIETGIWKFELTPRNIIVGNYDFWLPTSSVIGSQTGFLRPVAESTLTIPSAARNVISVGAYNSNNDSVAFFSGRGYTRGFPTPKPELVAPGVDIISAAPGGGYASRTGTSMATPFVTGAAAMLMQWGIINGNDPYLYGEKMKAYLIKGARKLPGFTSWPNQQVGYGALCVYNSIPR